MMILRIYIYVEYNVPIGVVSKKAVGDLRTALRAALNRFRLPIRLAILQLQYRSRLFDKFNRMRMALTQRKNYK